MKSFVTATLGFAAGLAFLVIVAFFVSPWSNFFLGGHFHIRGVWQGKGTFHSTTAGGDYTMWIKVEVPPSRHGDGPILSGSAVLCSPRGELLPLNIWANALRRHGLRLTGIPLRVQMNRWMPFALSGAVRDPHLDFRGTFGDDVLILEDRGSLGLAFTPDGRVRESLPEVPPSPETIRVTFEKTTLSRLPDGCVI